MMGLGMVISVGSRQSAVGIRHQNRRLGQSHAELNEFWLPREMLLRRAPAACPKAPLLPVVAIHMLKAKRQCDLAIEPKFDTDTINRYITSAIRHRSG